MPIPSISLECNINHNRKAIESILSQCLDPVLSSRRTVEQVANSVLALPEQKQIFTLHWVEVISKYNAELAYQFVNKVAFSLQLIGTEGTHQWLLNAMDIYDKQGLYPSCAAINDIEKFAQQFRLQHVAVALNQVSHILETILRGLTGRYLQVKAGNSIFTDTETIYLPAMVNRFDDKQKNYQLYKIMTVHLWAQTWFGTFKRPTPDSPHLLELLSQFDDPQRATQLFNALETLRLNACIQRYLPRLGKEIISLHDTPKIDNTWQACIEKLSSEQATVADTLKLTQQLYQLQIATPQPFIYQGELNLDQAQTTIEQRIQQHKQEVKMSIEELMQQMLNKNQNADDSNENQEMDISLSQSENETGLQINDENIAIPEQLSSILDSMKQDFEQFPEDWLTPENAGDYATKNSVDAIAGATENSPDVERDQNTFLYDEWDYRRQTYRKNWCSLKEHISHPLDDDFVAKTLQRYTHLVNDIRKHFEILREQPAYLRGQHAGDEIDIDALIDTKAETLMGREMNQRIYIHRQKSERDIAMILMVDVSGSTKGWINQIERESLVLLCQALEILGDKYAIYGFSGMTRNRCEIYAIKPFDMPYNDEVRARISGLRPKDYTRMGVAIRHLSGLLNEVEARTRVLITLSDGKPDDYDGYKGDYGIEDTRQALLEAKHSGIHPFCITIDTQASNYLPHMYGYNNYAVIDDIKKLPLKITDIYRHFTT